MQIVGQGLPVRPTKECVGVVFVKRLCDFVAWIVQLLAAWDSPGGVHRSQELPFSVRRCEDVNVESQSMCRRM